MKSLTKYLAFVRFGMVRATTERGEIYGRMLFFPAILAVFTALWQAAGAAGPREATPHHLVWYLAITEWIVLSAPQIFLDVQDDVVRGDLAAQLVRPVSYLGSVFCQALGMLCVRATVLGLLGAGVCYALTGHWPSAQLFAHIVPFGLCAGMVIVAMYLGMGVAAFWFADVSPLYWVWQKFMFILGGLMLPLPLFPLWMQRLGALTPFPAVLAGPASFVLTPTATPEYAWTLAAKLSFWLLVVWFASRWLFERALLRLQVNGG